MKTCYGILPVLIIYMSLMMSCSSHQPVSPDLKNSTIYGPHRQLWGLWNFEVTPDGNGSAEIEVIPVRSSQFHLNVVGIIENTPGGKLGVSNISLVDGILDVDVTLTHPIPNPRFTGFDVRGILIGHGAGHSFDPELHYAGTYDIQLLNPDGHTTLWNPVDYQGSGYIDGKLGKPNSIAQFTSQLNGYKYFADALTANMDVVDMDKSSRGAFSAGTSNTRHYEIMIGDKGLTFQYAIDANWYPPSEPVEVPGSFDAARANAPEPYHLSAYLSPDYIFGNDSEIVVDVYDWQKDVGQVTLQSNMLSNPVVMISGTDMGDFTRFSGTISNETQPSGITTSLLVGATGTDPDSSVTYSSYILYEIPLPNNVPGGIIITIDDDKQYKTLNRVYNYIANNYDWGNSDPAPVNYQDTDGPWDFTKIPATSESQRAALPKTDPEVSGFAGEFSGSVTHFWKANWVIATESALIYQAESHDTGNNKMNLWGIYEPNEYGAVKFKDPIQFVYPLDDISHFSSSGTATIIPFALTMTVKFERWGLNSGLAVYPVEPGLYGWGWDADLSLETRTLITISTGGALGQGELGKALLYEWIADNGTIVGTIITGHDPDGPFNFDESTYEITGTGGAETLKSIS